MNPIDHPDLTAYAMGELDAAQTTRVCQWLSQSPEAREELDQIQATLSLLQEAPSIPRRALHPRQRETVLAMAAATSRDQRVVPFATPDRPARRHVWNVVKYAAAASLTVGAFVLGQKSVTAPATDPSSDVAADHREHEVNPAPQSNTGLVAENTPDLSTSLEFAPVTAPAASTKMTEPGPAVQANAVYDGAIAIHLAKASASLPVAAKAEPAAAVAVAQLPAPASAPSLKAFAVAHRNVESVVAIQPKLLRPARVPIPDEFAGVKLASPMPINQKSGPEVGKKPEPQPALTIHSWKAEIASCPWDSSRRLLRFVAQVPVDQPGVEFNEAQYQLVAKFDPFHVQGYRLVGEKHMAPSQGNKLATRFAWYEIIPTRNFVASGERPVTVGTVELVQPRGNTPTLPALKIVDRGQTWNDSREDFVFETAMVGFSLLLQGTENVGNLNHKLVLEIAEKTKGEDPQGERAKFIQVVRQAQRVAGL